MPIVIRNARAYLVFGGFYSSLKVAQQNWNGTISDVSSSVNSSDMGVLAGVKFIIDQELGFVKNMSSQALFSYGLETVKANSNSASLQFSLLLGF